MAIKWKCLNSITNWSLLGLLIMTIVLHIRGKEPSHWCALFYNAFSAMVVASSITGLILVATQGYHCLLADEPITSTIFGNITFHLILPAILLIFLAPRNSPSYKAEAPSLQVIGIVLGLFILYLLTVVRCWKCKDTPYGLSWETLTPFCILWILVVVIFAFLRKYLK